MVGQVGLGIMGGAFAQHLLAAKFGVIGFDPDKKARAAHASRGGDCAASGAEVARQCNVIITSLPSIKAMEGAFPITRSQKFHDCLLVARHRHR